MANGNINLAKTEFNFGLILIWQKIGWLILRPIFRFFTGLRVELRCDVKELKGPLIVAANHSSFLDPTLLGAALPFGAKIFPLFFVTKDTIIGVPIFGGFLKMLGGFPARKGEGLEKSLEIPRQLLGAGQTVVFFPQGRLFPDFKIEQGRPGAAALARESGVPILPVAIKGSSQSSWLRFFLFGYRIKITVGEPFLLKDKITPESQQDLTPAIKIIMEEIEKLIL